MLDFKEEVIEFSFKGQKHQVRKPTNLELKTYVNKLGKCKDGNDRDNAFMEYIEGLGLKREIHDQLNPSQTKQLLEALNGAEKN